MTHFLIGLIGGLALTVFAPQAAIPLLVIVLIGLAVLLYERHYGSRGKRRGAKKAMPRMRQTRKS